MKILRNYIRHSLSILFLSIFLPLFSIASIVFLIKLATYTAIIQLSIWEMAKLFFFMLPELLFYTLPLSFFVAITLALFKLSNDNEIVVIFSLGIRPKFILKTLFIPSLFLSLILLFDFFVLFPHAKILSNNFLSYKRSEAKFNLSASEFGHKFGEWLLYIGADNQNETYSDVILFNKKQNEEVLIGAKKAEIINDSGILRLKLTSGEGYSYSKDKFTQIDFETMFINDTMKTDLDRYETPMEYWLPKIPSPKKKKMLIANILFSLFPVLSLFLAASIGIVHTRHQKGKIFLFLFLGITVYYTLAIALQLVISSYALPVLVFGWLIATYILYKKIIVAKF
ncbi:MAG: permease [Sulfurimonas sp. RIFCSPLOWO2_12_FULL_36_74]|jgi:lipopolysaccharide export system permease protein|uniref:LptF/LptG family permease n=1 Tax=Sulfurimonas sp. RIFCSPLOWO2_12_36_12 TaxID=1802253 RepID=UPI0008CA7B8B|nr:LptF/LptG family permease [Sulfurimonas sp. RIFCSPLOWO2_12_36_12]OHD98950.1 MAG: permease [Sulfurimonas sp. RIFCSPLOWO2_02_FULL_36_28]OHE02596.1 MAG: permease [Sulfurimonas sp. RIFCSPLOWO2_12_36_12]OHE07940.1 MAG: permease [Sulfurimonas sp. RIFCSPLOWO2_12_FULL_36_74]